jgi:hypothetical protein
LIAVVNAASSLFREHVKLADDKSDGREILRAGCTVAETALVGRQ